jgi:hypothetical protein
MRSAALDVRRPKLITIADKPFAMLSHARACARALDGVGELALLRGPADEFDQMRIFDTVSHENVSVIDVRAGLLTPTLRALRDVGFLESVKKGEFSLVVFHILGASVASLDEIEATSAFTGDASHFLVKNFINNTTFFEWDQGTQSSYFKKVKDAGQITIPKLNEMAFEQVELAAVPFLSFVANKDPRGDSANYSFVLRGYVRHWLGNVWNEYERIKLKEILANGPLAKAKGGGRIQVVNS